MTESSSNPAMLDVIALDSGALAWDKQDGLLPAVVQDAETYRVLMLGYMNAEGCCESPTARPAPTPGGTSRT